MTKQTRYVVLIAIVLVAYVLIQYLVPRPPDWKPTYLPSDKNPFGSYVTHSVLTSFFDGEELKTNNQSLYELQDSVHEGDNIISFSDIFDPNDEDANILFHKVTLGSSAFLSAYSFRGKFADSLKITTADVMGLMMAAGKMPAENDSSHLRFVVPGVEKRSYFYKAENIPFYFTALDSVTAPVYVSSTNAFGKPVTIRIPWGKGQFILNTTPLAFTNNYLLHGSNHRYAAQTLSVLPARPTWWISYYQGGRHEATSPFRFILSEQALRWGYYLILLGALLYLLFESKRRQRAIPIVEPLTNTSLEFIRTIGNMYLHANDHKAIAEKRITYFMDIVRGNHFMNSDSREAFIELVANKTGNSTEDAKKLFSLIDRIQKAKSISEEGLMELNNRIDRFTKRKT